MNAEKKMKNFVLDVDGVLTDGQFHYTKEGKTTKIFGPNDADAILLLKPYLKIIAITGDRKGFAITKKRVADDMKIPLYEVSTFERIDWLKDNGFNLKETIYMGDGIFDAMVFAKVAYSIAPANAIYTTKEKADFVTPSRGGDSAVAEACLYILEKFFVPFDPTNGKVEIKGGEWGK